MTTTNIKSALMSIVIAVVLAVFGYIIGIGDVFKIDLHVLINSGAMAFFIGVVSLLKSSNTTDTGHFMGVKVVDTPVSSEM